MSRHLLPKVSKSLTQTGPGEWSDFSSDFNAFASQIDIGDSEINVTSIPSPWARMILFDKAVQDVTHRMHLEAMSDILDVLQILFYRRILSYELSTVTVDLDNESESRFLCILKNLKPTSIPFDKIDLIIATDKRSQSNSFVLAGTSPSTLFFTPKDVRGKMNEFFLKEPVLLKDRPRDFQKYINNLFIEGLKEYHNAGNDCFKSLISALGSQGIINPDSDVNKSGKDIVKSSVSFSMFDAATLVYELKEPVVESKLCLKQNEMTSNPSPIVITTTRNIKGNAYYNDLPFRDNLNEENLIKHSREFLPSTDVRYPWILPKYDFLLPHIIKCKYKLNDKNLVLGTGSHHYYLLPLKQEFFKYFDGLDISSILNIQQEERGDVVVTLDVPTLGGKMSVSKTYTQNFTDRENCIIDLASDTSPLPHVLLWPNLHPENWSDSYYCYTYYGSNNEHFTPVFYDKHHTIITPRSYSRKSQNITVYELSTLPNYIQVTNNEVSGYIILDHAKLNRHDAMNQDVSIGIDFGTSHTIVAIRDNTNVDTLQYSSKFDNENINDRDFIPLFDFTEDEVRSGAIPKLIYSTLNQYFLPNILGSTDEQNKVSMPLPTMVIWETDSANNALITNSINFSKNEVYSYPADGMGINKKYLTETNLKWTPDKLRQELAKEYLKILILIIKYELTRRNIDYSLSNSSKLVVSWAYPKSFSEIRIKDYKQMWESLLQGFRIEYSDESKSSLMYFNHKGDVPKNSSDLTLVIDVGGGSSDISGWQNGQLNLLYSTLWAGKNLTGFDKEDAQSTILSSLKEYFQEVKLPDGDDLQTQLNYMLYQLTAKDIRGFSQTDTFYRTRFTILFFFSSLFWEIGIQCLRFKEEIGNNINICMAGNGSRFICWSSDKPDNVDQVDLEIYSKLLSICLEKPIDIQFHISNEFKKEVAIGLTKMDDAYRKQIPAYSPTIAEIVDQKESYPTIEEYKDYLDRNKPSNIRIDEKQSEIARFMRAFADVISDSDIYKEKLSTDPKLKDVKSLCKDMTGNWTDLEGWIRDTVDSNMKNYLTLSSSVFVMGMQQLIGKLHMYLNSSS